MTRPLLVVAALSAAAYLLTRNRHKAGGSVAPARSWPRRHPWAQDWNDPAMDVYDRISTHTGTWDPRLER